MWNHRENQKRLHNLNSFIFNDPHKQLKKISKKNNHHPIHPLGYYLPYMIFFDFFNV